MTIWEAFLFGAVQGLTEYLPISSSAHLILLPRFLGTQDPGLSFDVFLHAGTLTSTLWYFRADWLGLLERKASSLKLWKLLIIGTLPALICGALFHRWVETALRGNQVLATTLVVGGLLLWGVDAWRSRRERDVTSDHGAKKMKAREFGALTLNDAFLVGVAQACALVPGMSRSGSTMIGGRLLGFSRESAARFSFLLSAPITAAALVFELKDFKQVVESQVGLLPLLTGALSAFVFGWFAIDLLLKLLRKFGYLSFAVYRVVLAVVIYKVLGF